MGARSSIEAHISISGKNGPQHNPKDIVIETPKKGQFRLEGLRFTAPPLRLSGYIAGLIALPITPAAGLIWLPPILSSVSSPVICNYKVPRAFKYFEPFP